MTAKSGRIVSATIGGVELTAAPDNGEVFGGSTWERKAVWRQQVAALCYAMARARDGAEAIALQMCAREHWAKSRQNHDHSPGPPRPWMDGGCEVAEQAPGRVKSPQ